MKLYVDMSNNRSEFHLEPALGRLYNRDLQIGYKSVFAFLWALTNEEFTNEF